MPSWAVPLLVAAGVGLVATPVARRLALSTGLVDRPAPDKSHRHATPYLGGVAIALAVVAGVLAGRASAVGLTLVGCACVLVVVGLVDDDRTLPPLPRLAVEVACGIAAVAVGVRLDGTGVARLGLVLPVLLLVGGANSLNLLDNLDGLASGVVVAGAGACVALGVVSGHPDAVVTGAALAGACLAFLAFNARPASIFMGDAGSLFLGFLLAAEAMRAGATLPPPASVAFPFMLLALPIADTSTVVLGRLRHGLSPWRGGRDHLSHRLAAAGLGPGRAVVLLVAVEAALAALAVLSTRGPVPLAAGVGAGAALVLALVAFAGRIRVYREEARGLPRWFVLGGALVVAVLLALPLPALFAALRARQPALAGEAAARAGLAAAGAGKLHLAAADFATASASFAVAEADLRSPLTSVGLAYPVLATNLAAVRELAALGQQLAAAGGAATTAGGRFAYTARGGAIPVAQMAATSPALASALGIVQTAIAEMAVSPQPYVLSSVARAWTLLRSDLGPAERRVVQALAIATNVPPLLGLDGRRTYFLAFQDDAESRATGGLIGLYGLLVADHGRLGLSGIADIGRLDTSGSTHRVLQAPPDYLVRYGAFDPAYDWQNVNLSPDFPTVAGVISDLYPQSGGVPVDGVVAVDSSGLAALLQLTGPVSVAGWPVPISAANVVPITLETSYVSYASDQARHRFLSALVEAVFTRLKSLSLSDPSTFVDDLLPAVVGHHLQVFSDGQVEERWLASIGVAGATPPVVSDSLELVTQNAAGDKIDWWLRRSLAYTVTVTPLAPVSEGAAPSAARVSGQVTVTLRNTAPASGLPSSLIGPYEPGLVAGENRSYVTLYTPLAFTSVTSDGRAAGLSSSPELGRQADSTFVEMPAGTTATLSVGLSGDVSLLPGGWYELDLPCQPLVFADQVSVTIKVGGGYVVAAVRGGAGGAASFKESTREVTASLLLDQGEQIWLRLAPAG